MTFWEIALKIEIQWSEPHQAFRKLPALHIAVGRKQTDAPFTDEDEQRFSNGDFSHLLQFDTENLEKIQKQSSSFLVRIQKLKKVILKGKHTACSIYFPLWLWFCNFLFPSHSQTHRKESSEDAKNIGLVTIDFTFPLLSFFLNS